jgi:hypothetical protein
MEAKKRAQAAEFRAQHNHTTQYKNATITSTQRCNTIHGYIARETNSSYILPQSDAILWWHFYLIGLAPPIVFIDHFVEALVLPVRAMPYMYH